MIQSFPRWNWSVFSQDAPGSSNLVPFHVPTVSVSAQQLPQSKQSGLRDGLAPFSTSLMFHQPLSGAQYGNCKAWRFAIIKHNFNDVTPGWKRGAGQPGRASPLRLFCAPPSQLTASSFRSALISQLNLCLLIFQGEKRRRIRCFLLLGAAICSASPGVFSTREQTAPGAPRHHTALTVPRLCFPRWSLTAEI